MFILILLFFGFVLINFTAGPSRVVGGSDVLGSVVNGETALRRYSGQRVWITRLSPLLRQQSKELETFVDARDDSCSVFHTVCVFSALTSRDGIEIVFSANKPAQLSADQLWHGGFIDPTSGAVFDRLGRAYLVNKEGQSELKMIHAE